ncbi:hypothetical protein E2C01_077163 [Portunus trituberculatus]|uniref:Uncharacterized protein n=1 Tax=Portunus trituberculatus TaxID=210409 RepID=A0A5B7IF43_PORTR|nr:hypothetical protein [Portunus trituberculatus]
MPSFTSASLLFQVWVPEVLLRGTRSLDTFTFLQKFQGVTISSDSTVYTSVI